MSIGAASCQERRPQGAKDPNRNYCAKNGCTIEAFQRKDLSDQKTKETQTVDCMLFVPKMYGRECVINLDNFRLFAQGPDLFYCSTREYGDEC